MRQWVFALGLGCTGDVTPEAPAPAPIPAAPQVSRPAVQAGPTRGDILAQLKKDKPVSARLLGSAWTRVGTHLDERVLKPVCGGDVPRLGLTHAAAAARLHAFDGHQMVVHDILGVVEIGAGLWRVWIVPRHVQGPVHEVRVTRVDASTTRWRGAAGAPDWADGAEWIRDPQGSGLVRVEQPDCQP